MLPLIFFAILRLSLLFPSTSALDFLFNSFTTATNLTFIDDARIESRIIRLTNDANQLSQGRVFHRTPLTLIPTTTNTTTNTTTLSSFTTQFIFSILPQISTSPGFGLCFVISNTTNPPGALAGQYLGLFSNADNVGPLIAIEFDTGINQEFNDPDGNHVGVDLNFVQSVFTRSGGYYNSTGGFVPLNMRTGQNIHAWIEFDGPQFQINVTIAPAGIPKPTRPLLTYSDRVIANYVSRNMFVGFSASKTTWVEAQRVLAWSLSDTGVARDINTTNLPVFLPATSSSSLSRGAIAGITVGCAVVFVCILGVCYWFWEKNRRKGEEEDEIEDWELEFWPHRYSYEELSQATNGFSKDELLGAGGFGKVYKGKLSNDTELAVKCINHDSKQGLREFMAEISSMGRLQHKNLVPMRGWCRKGNELLLVYDYMPNGSLNNWIFGQPKKLMGWKDRRRVLADVAEGLNYLHYGWEQVVVHRDIKSSNILLDSEMRGRLGDFGLAKLYTHGELPNTTRVVGTLGYLAPELATIAAPTTASDVYSFGVVILEVACGRKPIESWVEREEDAILIDWVRNNYGEGTLLDTADVRIKGEYEVEEMEAMLKLGLVCCHPDPLRRPNMREVVAVLVGEGVATAPADLLSELGPGLINNDDGKDEEGTATASPPQIMV